AMDAGCVVSRGTAPGRVRPSAGLNVAVDLPAFTPGIGYAHTALATLDDGITFVFCYVGAENRGYAVAGRADPDKFTASWGTPVPLPPLLVTVDDVAALSNHRFAVIGGRAIVGASVDPATLAVHMGDAMRF